MQPCIQRERNLGKTIQVIKTFFKLESKYFKENSNSNLRVDMSSVTRNSIVHSY